MFLRLAPAFLSLLAVVRGHSLQRRDYEQHDYYAVHLDPAVQPLEFAQALDIDYLGPLGELKDHHLFSTIRGTSDVISDAQTALRLRRRKRDAVWAGHPLDGVLLAQKQVARRRLFKRQIPGSVMPPTGLRQDASGAVAELVAKQQVIAQTLGIEDPIFAGQWHLLNVVEPGHDLNVTGVWLEGITGHNSTVALIDDGLDMYSEDLRQNYFAAGSWDFNDHHPEPRPILSDDRHGTRCAGEIAAVKNNVCGVGVAWDSKVSGIRILSKPISDADEAESMNYAMDRNHIYSCSWGPPDDGKSMDAPGILIKRAIVNGIQNGRDGKGSIFVFASGNGASHGDNCNFDGYTNSIYSITVGAIDRKGLHPYYSEECSAQLVVTYSSGSGDAIHTTDVGPNNCYDRHGGTSAAAPLAAGVYALVLSIRPDLTWRDLQYLTVDTAVPINEDDSDWKTTAIGKKYNHKYGYGKLDTWAIVQAAKTHKLVKPQAWYTSPWLQVNSMIPENNDGLVSHFTVSEGMIKAANIARLEHVTVTMNIRHQRRGDLSVTLISPAGVESRLSERRQDDTSQEGYTRWTFMSVVHWGEKGAGDWKVIVRDAAVNDMMGTFVDWRLTLWAEAEDASRATLVPMPTDQDDDDTVVPVGTTTVPVMTTSLEPIQSTTLPTIPTDHITRPVNEKPSSSSSPSSVGPPQETTTFAPPDVVPPAAEVSEKPSHSNWIPSFLPTFGVSKRTQVWVYGSLVVVVLFVSGVGAYMFLARRRRQRRDNFSEVEFTLVDNPEFELDENLERGEKHHRKGQRAGELYNAFAGGDSDEDLVSDIDEKDDQDYADTPSDDEDEAGGDRARLLRK